MRILDQFVVALRQASSYNRHDLAPPQVILWPDEDGLWGQCIDVIRSIYPTLYSLGEYSTSKESGPAAWLRYKLENEDSEDVPVIYLPGIGRGAFRSADQCPEKARHLFALQFQGQFWTQKNGKDWTPLAFLSSADNGIGLDVASDQETKKAIQECLVAFMEVEVEDLRSRKLEAGDFRAIVTKDPARILLRWMGDGNKVKGELQRSISEWESFSAVCRSEYGFDPETDGAITAAEKLISTTNAWQLVWMRYKEAPHAYPGIKELLGSVIPSDLFTSAGEYFPSSNANEEKRLERDLLALSSAAPKDALAKIYSLAKEHVERANWVWAKLGDSPLAFAIGHLRDLAELVQTSGSHFSWEALSDYYATTGWKVDRSAVRALNVARTMVATKAVTAALRSIYQPWLESLAIHAQSIRDPYPTTGLKSCRNFKVEEGSAYIFADGLRMDMGKGLEENLIASGLEVSLSSSWTALPSVTATAKPAWLPLAEALSGPLEDGAFQPKEKASGKALTQTRFKQLMEERGMLFMSASEIRLPHLCAWTEFGNFDTYGHDQGAKLAWRVEEELAGLQERIGALLSAGWSTVYVVTDHGWLMLPGGLPKVVLPKHLTTSQWGRCANPGAGAQHGYPMTSWFWDQADAVVLAPGISCFREGLEYSHGGLTLQEALIPSLKVSLKRDGPSTISMKEMRWSGLRLNMIIEGAEGLTVDLRSKAADMTTSFVLSPTTGAAKGQKTSLLVTDGDAVGAAAFVVVINQDGQVMFKYPVVIGEN
jgi:hypothetical protein